MPVKTLHELNDDDLLCEVQLPEDTLIYGDMRYLGVLVGYDKAEKMIQTDLGWVDVDENEPVEVFYDCD